MRALFALALLTAAVPTLSTQAQSWNFRVLLDGREIGRHEFTLHGSGATRELRSEARFDVRWLFIDAYRYRHTAVEHWEGDCLRSLSSRTRTNDEQQTVTANTRDGRLTVERTTGVDSHQGCIMTFAYWNKRIVQARQLLNSQTGELVPVQINAHGKEIVIARGQPIRAQRYRISGPELQVDLWYADFKWVALEALAQGKRRLRYELV